MVSYGNINNNNREGVVSKLIAVRYGKLVADDVVTKSSAMSSVATAVLAIIGTVSAVTLF